MHTEISFSHFGIRDAGYKMAKFHYLTPPSLAGKIIQEQIDLTYRPIPPLAVAFLYVGASI